MSQLPQLTAGSTLGDQAYDAIRAAIVSGGLPRGDKVTERGLAESLNISPTPVREALRRLEQDRLVERIGPRMVRIAQFDEQDLLEITMIQDSLRALAARLAAHKATPAQLDEMRIRLDEAEALVAAREGLDPAQGLDAGFVDRVRVLMHEFHELTDQASGNPTLFHMLQMVDAFGSQERRTAVFRDLEVDWRAVDERYRQHRGIFEAIAARDGDEAYRLVMEHSRTSNSARIAARINSQ